MVLAAYNNCEAKIGSYLWNAISTRWLAPLETSKEDRKLGCGTIFIWQDYLFSVNEVCMQSETKLFYVIQCFIDITEDLTSVYTMNFSLLKKIF